MAWFYVDDHLHDHRKPRKAGLEAMGLWTLAGSWCADNLTDGFVPRDVAIRWGGRKLTRLAAQLCDADLWHETEQDGEPGWQFHDWTGWQKTREQVEELRAKRSAAGARGGRKSGTVRRTKAQASASAVASALGEAKTNPVPSLKELPPLPPGSNPPAAVVQHPMAGRTSTHPKGTDGHQRHATHENTKRACIDLERDRKLPIAAPELLAWCYRLGQGNPWAGYTEVKRHTEHELDSARNPTSAIRARLRDATPKNRDDNALNWLKESS